MFDYPVDYKQTDKRWANISYTICNNKSQTIGRTGSGPTLAADVVATLKDKNVTPIKLAQQAIEWGCRTHNCGTAWPFWAKVADHYGFSKFIRTTHFEHLQECLDAGGLVVCNMKVGYWVPITNYILVWLYDNNYVYGITAHKSRKNKQPTEQFKAECKQYFCFYP